MLRSLFNLFTAKKSAPPIAQHVIPPHIGRPRKYPFPQMRNGDSFFRPNMTASSLGCAGRAHFRKHPKPGCKFMARKVTENGVKGARIWLVEDKLAND